jgi:hypothetical protein
MRQRKRIAYHVFARSLVDIAIFLIQVGLDAAGVGGSEKDGARQARGELDGEARGTGLGAGAGGGGGGGGGNAGQGEGGGREARHGCCHCHCGARRRDDG